MLTRSILSAIIGFLAGCLLYYVADASVVIVLIMGSVGYFFGLFLDNADIKHQHETFNFSTLPSSQEIFQSIDLPEATIFYSPKENLTTVFIDFIVETKPQTFRLSVLKNLQEYQFQISEDFSKTMFSLTLDFPECNYPKLLSSSNHREEFHYNIREQSLDFQNAVQKIIPGLVLSKLSHLDRFGDEKIRSCSGTSPRPSQFPPPTSTSNNSYNLPPNGYEREISHSIQDVDSEEIQTINESSIMEDLLPGSSMEPKIPDLSPDEVLRLKDSNKLRLEAFLNENDESDEVFEEEPSDGTLDSNEPEISDDLEIDFSKVDQPVNSDLEEDFEQDIINRIEERTKIALSKVKPDLDLKRERDEVKKYITGEATTEETVS